MMSKFLLLVLASLVMISCSSSSTSAEKRCTSFKKNNYIRIHEDNNSFLVQYDTVRYTEVKYDCVFSAMYTKKAMFDKFGKWQQAIYRTGQRHPILIWHNIKLFPQDSTRFMVVADGNESRETIYASVMVLDADKNDLLDEGSPYKEKLVNYFGEMIRANNSNRKIFYEFYWKEVDPQTWEKIKKHYN